MLSNYTQFFLKAALWLSAISLHAMESCRETQNTPLERISILTNHLIPQKMLGDRLASVQAAVDSAFEYNKDAHKDDWLYKGNAYYYELLNLDDDALLKYIANENPHEKDIYIIDVGCGQEQWGKHVQEILKTNVFKKTGIQFHIFIITGGKECDEKIEHHDHVTLYQFNQFKIENIDEEFAKRGFNLKNKVHLIVSNWTMRHLVDPFGTLKRMYSLLRPKYGKLLSNGFLFKYDDSKEIQVFPFGNENILIASNAICLFRMFTVGRDAGQFLLVRKDHEELKLPLKYNGQILATGWGWQCSSGRVTVFKKCHLPLFKLERINADKNNYDYIYYAQNDPYSKALYTTFLNKNLFVKNL